MPGRFRILNLIPGVHKMKINLWCTPGTVPVRAEYSILYVNTTL